MGITVEDKGTYTLIMKLDRQLRLKVGALGEVFFDEGYYAYTGSALGNAGFARVRRHKEVASGRNKTRQWHIDYLLPHVEIVEIVTSPRPECTVAAGIDKRLARITGFGCSDCRCLSHLHYTDNLDSMKKAVRTAHKIPVI
jgi:Uri superfamily endonuclease